MGTADVLPENRMEFGVFAPLRYGLSDSVELSTHPLLNVLMPNLALKVRWLQSGDVTVSSRHNLTYPSGLFNFLSKDGAMGILPKEADIPHIIGLTTEGLVSWKASDLVLVTGKASVMVAARVGETNLPTMDLPLVFPRTAAYLRGWSATFGVDTRLTLSDAFALNFDLDFFLLPTKRAPYHVEHSGMVAWKIKPDLRLSAGYKVVYGRYPFGGEWNFGGGAWPFPLVDFEWAFD